MKGEMERWYHDELIHYKKCRNSLILDLTTANCISLHFNVPKKNPHLQQVFGFKIHWPVATKLIDPLPQWNRRCKALVEVIVTL